MPRQMQVLRCHAQQARWTRSDWTLSICLGKTPTAKLLVLFQPFWLSSNLLADRLFGPPRNSSCNVTSYFNTLHYECTLLNTHSCWGAEYNTACML